MDSETNFLLQALDGYSFRNIVGLIKGETDIATMILSPKKVEISFVNTSKCAVHKIVINTSELSRYRYDIRDEEGNLYPEFPVAFETDEIYNTTKGIGKRDGICLYWLKGDHKINIQPIKPTKDLSKAGALFVKIIHIEFTRCIIPEIYNSEPNIRILAKDFADLCGQTNSLKCSYLEISGEANKVVFTGILANNTPANIARFAGQNEVMPSEFTGNSTPANISGEIESLLRNLRENQETSKSGTSTGLTLNVVKNNILARIKVPISTVKALAKIHNISPPGTLLRLYFKEEQPVKIESPISTYGVYTICIRNIR